MLFPVCKRPLIQIIKNNWRKYHTYLIPLQPFEYYTEKNYRSFSEISSLQSIQIRNTPSYPFSLVKTPLIYTYVTDSKELSPFCW